MMWKRIVLAAGASAAILTGACSGGTEPDDGCNEIFNTSAGTRGDTVVTTTGLRYIDVVRGTGATVVSCRRVALFYRGTFLDGSEFAPRAPLNPPIRPGLGQVIAGFDQGVIGMRAGGTRRLIIPPTLGYGSVAQTDRNTGKVVIPANSTVVFDIEVVAVE